MAELRGVQILQNEIEKSKDRLKEFNENIKKLGLTGSENPGPRGRRMLGVEGQEYDDGFSGRMGRGRGRLFGIAKRGLMEESGPPVKRRIVGGAFSRLGPAPVQRRVREDSPEEDDRPTRLSVHSSVVSTSRDSKNRQEIMQEQTKDKEGMQRNRRMFGLLLGTLNKFKTDSKTMESKAEQRKRIDQKLEENAEKEKKKFKQDTMQLMEERHLEQTRISRLEQKMEVVQEHGDREKEMKKLKNFLCTKAKPRIFWKPRQMNSAAENKLKDSIKVVDDMLRASQDRLEKEIKDVMEREHKREERIKMRLREDGLFQDEEENKEKENDEKEKRVGGVGIKQTEGNDGLKSQGRGEKSNDRDEEKSSGKKVKAKRRVIVEEQSDRESESEEEDREEVSKMSKEDDEGKKKVKKESRNVTKVRQDKEDDDDSESSSDSDGDKNKKVVKKRGHSDSPSSSRNVTERAVDEEDNDDEEEETSRVVLYRGNSKDKAKPEKESRKKNKDEEKSERRSHGDKHKHSHRHSKHSKRDSEKIVIKEEVDEEKHGKKKSKSSERTVVKEVEEDEGKQKENSSASDKRNPMNLIGEEDDVEMESENNITI